MDHLIDQLRRMATEVVIWRDRDGRPLAVRRVADAIWHIEENGRPIRAGSAVQIASFIQRS